MGILSRSNLLVVFILLSWHLPYKVYAQDDSTEVPPSIVHKIIITGNKVTRLHIVMRELIFHSGDTLPSTVLQNSMLRSQENLMNTGLFNFVEINQYPGEGHTVDVHINLTERWYIWPLPFFEVVDRNFNEWWLTKDFSRSNYGIYLVHENFRGRDESLKIQVRLGYSQRIGLFYSIPYINKKQNLGIAFGGYYTRNHEITIATKENKLVNFKDPDRFIRQDWTFYTSTTYRTGFYDYYSASAEYRKINVADTIIVQNDQYFVNPENNQQQIRLDVVYKHDKRDYQPYALKGNLFQIDIAKIGLGILKNEPNLLSLGLAYRHYFEWLPRWHSSIAISGKVSGMKDTPFTNMRALGYGSDLVRGYEYYVINGTNFILFKTTLIKFTLLPTHIYNVPLIKSEKFRKIPNTIYFSLSSDAGYVSDHQFSKNNPLSNKWLSGYGAGIDYVTYYDMVLRVEYSFNNLGEHGLFLNFAAPF